MPFIRTLSAEGRKRLCIGLGGVAVTLLITLGVFASNDWLPKTDPMTGKRFGWFGKPLASNAPSSWNPIAAVIPTPTPTPLPLSKEYLYAGSRLLAVEDANATAAPPADIAVWRPSNGWWYVMGQTGSAQTFLSFGVNGDIPLVGDYEGDGKTDFTVYRPASSSIFYIWPSNGTGYWGFYWGTNTLADIPVAADFDGDGKTDYVVARPDAGDDSLAWWIRRSSDSTYIAPEFGTDTDVLAPADYDGDGMADLAYFRPGNTTLYWKSSSDDSTHSVDLGQNGTVVSSDYDGDGKADPAIFVGSTATWYIHYSTTGTTSSHVWGTAGTSGCTGGDCSGIVPVHNDYDLDGKTDLAVWRATGCGTSAVWKIKRSSNGTTRTDYWGCPGDIPVPAFYRR